MRLLASAGLLALLLAGTATAKTIVGTARSERLSGTLRADLLIGGAGRDRIHAGRGNDRIAAEYDGARDRVFCGRGRDVVTADQNDTVSSDCELVSRRLSRDPYRDAGAQHETEVEPDSFTFGRTTVTAFQVGRRFDGGASNIGFAVSRDDGRTWRSGFLPALSAVSSPRGPSSRVSDPVVAYDATHGAWLIAALAIAENVTRLTVSRSTDGVSWSAPVVAAEAATRGGVAFDKEWIACDNGSASPFAGTCYLAYSDVARRDVVAAKYSVDGGLTWSAQVQVSQTDGVGVIPAIRPNGDLVLVYLAQERRLDAALSTDGGVTFAPPVTVANVNIHGERGLRFPPLPSADADGSGRVWVTWHDCRFSSSCSSNSVVVATSADGRTWTAPGAVTSGRNAFIPAIGVNSASGRAAIVYYTLRPAGIDLELVESRSDGSGWGPPRRVSARTMRVEWIANTSSGRMLADYVSVHYAGGRPLAVWSLASEPVRSSLRQAIYATRG